MSEQQRSDGDDGAQAHGLGEDHPQHVHLQKQEVLPAAVSPQLLVCVLVLVRVLVRLLVLLLGHVLVLVWVPTCLVEEKQLRERKATFEGNRVRGGGGGVKTMPVPRSPVMEVLCSSQSLTFFWNPAKKKLLRKLDSNALLVLDLWPFTIISPSFGRKSAARQTSVAPTSVSGLKMKRVGFRKDGSVQDQETRSSHSSSIKMPQN